MPKRDGLRTDLKQKLKVDKSTPDWKEKVIDRVLGRELKQKKLYGNDVYLRCGNSFRSLVLVAAKQRGISRSGYMRRAAAAFVAYDLGIDAKDVVEDGPRDQPWAEKSRYHDKGDPEDGVTNFGPWRIESLHD